VRGNLTATSPSRLIVVSEVTLTNMEAAVTALAEEGFFDDKGS
jgi:hypothetical protein